MSAVQYSIDTSILIENWQRLYPPDVFPTVWDFLDRLIKTRVAVISEEVYDELTPKDDELLAWAKERQDFLYATSEEVQKATMDINDEFPDLTDTERERSVADPFVIAIATLEECAVVTYEEPRTKPTRPRKIPDVCFALQIQCFDFVELARREGVTL